MNVPETVRLFVALEVPDDVRQAMAAWIRDLRGDVPTTVCRWVRPEGIHLTLKFLGDVEPGRLAATRDALAPAASACRCFSLQPAAAGTFGGSRTRVVWLGLTGDVETAGELSRQVNAALVPAGFAPDRRRFRPHLTVARVRDRATAGDRRRIAAAVAALDPPPLPQIRVTDMALVQSLLHSDGARYQVLERYSLTGG